MKYVGYREFCPVHRYAKVLRISHYLQRSRKLAAIAPLIGKIADQGFIALQSFGRRKGGRVAQVLSSFDERFDDLWNQIGPELATLTVRDRQFLKWRYQKCPLREYKTLGLLSEDESRLLGYLIYYVEDHSALCADLFAPGSAEDIDCLLSCWEALASGDGLASLSVSCSDGELAAALIRQRFSRRSIVLASKPNGTRRIEQSKTLFALDRHTVTEPPLAGNWYYTEGDSPY